MVRRAALALIALLLGGPGPATGGPAAPGDSLATERLLASASGFTIHRVPNLRWRPSVPAAAAGAGAGAARARSPVAVDWLSSQITRRDGAGLPVTDWSLAAGEEMRGGGALEFAASGVAHGGNTSPTSLRATALRGDLTASLGDVPPLALENSVALHRVRGVALRLAPRDGAQWQMAAGGVSPAGGAARPRLAIGAASVSGVAYDDARFTMEVAAFRRRSGGTILAGPDTLASAGASASLGVRAPLFAGTLRQALLAESHGVAGARTLAAGHVLEWSLVTPSLVVLLHDEWASPRSLAIGTDRLARRPRRSDRWNVQSRFLEGRAELHGTGLVQEGGEPELDARNFQFGTSGDLGPGAWYAGADVAWNRRGRDAAGERRVALHVGTGANGRAASLIRLEHVAVADRASVALEDQTTVALAHGMRLVLSPRARWSGGGFERAGSRIELGSPLRGGARLTSSVTVEAASDRGFRPVLEEATVALMWSPRDRDRASLELRRREENGSPSFETAIGYDAQASRYAGFDRGIAGRDSTRLTVRVSRSGNGSGVPNALVSLDGRELRFTDADGIARFDRVGPGLHVIAVDERSLPGGHQVVGTSRAFVTVERNVPPGEVAFTIARPERRVKF